MNCVYCNIEIDGSHELNGLSNFAGLGGLQSPCCNCCFSANDYSVKSHGDLLVKSMRYRDAVERAAAIEKNMVEGDIFSADLATKDFAPRRVSAKYERRCGSQIVMHVLSDDRGGGGYNIASSVDNCETS